MEEKKIMEDSLDLFISGMCEEDLPLGQSCRMSNLLDREKQKSAFDPSNFVDQF